MSDASIIEEAAPSPRGGNGSVVPYTAGPGTDFMAVAIGVGANIEGLPAYFADPLLQTGNMPGIAISAFNNRALRQGTFVASSLCQWISDQTNLYVPDDGNQINWISEFQNALAAFVEALIPPGPNLGAYLPLSGGTMVGNIQFQSGITTVLANNTWYRALDTVGNARGLILKGSDNNITINDGSSAYVTIAGDPVTNNNYAWSGRDNAGTVHPVIGLLSDNAIHIGSSGTSFLFIDVTTNIYTSASLVLNNNRFIWGNDTGGTPRQLLGMTTSNTFSIGASVPAQTDIYAGGGASIYFHANAIALAQLYTYGYCYIQGGARAYIPGGNDPLTIYADNGYYARTQYLVGGTRQWSVGVLPSGPFQIADETAAAIRFEIDLSGNVTFYNYQTVNGGMTVGGNFQCNNSISASVNLSCGNTLFVYNQAQVWNSVVVNTGNLYVQNGGVYATGSVNGNYLSSSGDCGVSGSLNVSGNGQVNGNFNCSSQISCNVAVANYVVSYGNLQINGSSTVNGNEQVSGNFNCSNQVSSNTSVANHVQSNGDINANGTVAMGNNCSVGQHLTVSNGFCLGGSGINFDYTMGWPIGNHLQTVSGIGMYAQFFQPYSDERLKRNVVAAERDALAAIKPLKFFSYDSPRTTPEGTEVIDAASHVAVGFLAQQVRESMADAVAQTEQPVSFVMDHPEVGEIGCHFDTQPALALDIMTMLAYSLRAIQQLVDRVEQLEGKA